MENKLSSFFTVTIFKSKHILFLFAILFFPIFLNAQRLELTVFSNNKEALADANVFVNGKFLGITDVNGKLNFNLEDSNSFFLEVNAANYESFSKNYLKKELKDFLHIYLFATEITDLNEIVITAGRKSENISTIPSSVSILSFKEIQNQMEITSNLSTILGNTIPGLGTSTGRSTNAGQTLRGRQVLVLIDGIPQSTPLMNGSRDMRTIDPNAIERIEVIKGATSIYGNGSGGGIINYITKKYTGDQPIQGKTTLGSTFNPFNGNETLGYNFSQLISGKSKKITYFASATFDYTGLLRDGDGIVLGQNDGLSNTNQNNVFAKIDYDINDTQEVTAWYNFYSSTQKSKYISENGLYGSIPTIGIKGEDLGEDAGTPYNHNALIKYKNNSLFWHTSLDVTAYFNSFQSMNRYVAKASAWYGPGQTMINSTKKGLRLNFNTSFELFEFSADITYGLDYLNDITDQDLTDGRVYIPKMHMTNIAPYTQLQFFITPNLVFKGGLRHERARVKVQDYRTINLGPNNEGSIFVNGGTIPYNATVYNAGLRFNKFSYFNPFLSFSQAFSINEIGRILRRADENVLGNLQTDPIITNNYEIGFSSRISIFNLNAAFYKSTSKLGMNLVERNGFAYPQREPENVYGFELALDAKISENWGANASYAYVEGKAKFENGTKQYLNGARIAPPKSTASIYYTLEKFRIQLYWVYSGNRNRFDLNDKDKYNINEGPVKDISLFNLATNYNFNKQLSLSLGVENVFNKTYFPVVSQYRAIDAEYIRASGSVINLNMFYKF